MAFNTKAAASGNRVCDRREFIKALGFGSIALGLSCRSRTSTLVKQPNILFCIADDWGWPHAGVYADPVVRTPAFDRIAREGVLFDHTFVSSPSCTPSRNSILTGQYHWRLEEGANLWSTLDIKFPVFPLLLAEAGYHVGNWRKCWGPGDIKAGGYTDTYPGGKRYPKGFAQFLDARPLGKPFCFWLGSSDPHRPYDKGSGKASGMDLSKIRVPGFYPDVPEIRSDIADYYYEVQRFDSDCAAAMALLEEVGELENTIIVMTGDHGMPFPRCKSNIYDWGARVPLAIRWRDRIKPGRRVTDFVSFVDFAPTFLDAAGLKIPDQMCGRSLLTILGSEQSGRVDKSREHVIFGKERHVPAQESPEMGGYPCRGLRTDRFLYIRNFVPERWPAGVPEGATHPIGRFADCDDGPTKSFLMDHRENPEYKRFFELAFAKRPAEELYDMEKDPDQLNNVADDLRYSQTRSELSSRLMAELKTTSDPRASDERVLFDEYPYRAKYKLKR
ncbi:MAG: sulfatase [Candidatus Aminicenantes bacterium]|nr:sulfatase [Candidatus Aminicenantes bacterium]